MNSLKKGEGVPLLNFEGGPGVPLLNFEVGPGVPLLNFRGVPGPTFKLWGGSRVPVPLLHHAEGLLVNMIAMHQRLLGFLKQLTEEATRGVLEEKLCLKLSQISQKTPVLESLYIFNNTCFEEISKRLLWFQVVYWAKGWK